MSSHEMTNGSTATNVCGGLLTIMVIRLRLEQRSFKLLQCITSHLSKVFMQWTECRPLVRSMWCTLI